MGTPHRLVRRRVDDVVALRRDVPLHEIPDQRGRHIRHETEID